MRAATISMSPPEQLGRSFKAALAAMRRMRGREPRRPGELRDAQYALLFSLVGGSASSLTELAEAADLSPAAATEMLDALAKAGLVQRVRSDHDRRVVLSSLTERGLALVQDRRRRMEPRWNEAFAQFSDEDLLTAAAVLDKLRQFFDEIADERA